MFCRSWHKVSYDMWSFDILASTLICISTKPQNQAWYFSFICIWFPTKAYFHSHRQIPLPVSLNWGSWCQTFVFYKILWLHLSNDAGALCQNMTDPPCKYRVTCNTAMYRIFSHLHRVWVLHIFEGHPCCAAIIPLDEDFNPLCCLYATLCSGTHCDERVLLLYVRTVVPMVDNLLEY